MSPHIVPEEENKFLDKLPYLRVYSPRKSRGKKPHWNFEARLWVPVQLRRKIKIKIT
jgi:hypothetical protein